MAQTPNNIAVAFEAQLLTYKELNAKANQLAHYLRSVYPCGEASYAERLVGAASRREEKLSPSDSPEVGTEVLVGICVERSPLMIIGLLGILKAGGAYPGFLTSEKKTLGLVKF